MSDPDWIDDVDEGVSALDWLYWAEATDKECEQTNLQLREKAMNDDISPTDLPDAFPEGRWFHPIEGAIAIVVGAALVLVLGILALPRRVARWLGGRQ